MTNVWIIARREFKRYFISPVAYAVAVAIYLILGLIFSLNIWLGAPSGQLNPDGRMVLQPLILILVFVTPALTMRLLADEHRLGTMELLLTAPVKDWELVIGKWLGSLGFLGLILAGTVVYPLILDRMTFPGIDQGVLVSAYLGLFALMAAMLALGLLTSAIFTNPVVAWVTGVATLLGLWILGAVGSGASPGSQLAGYLGLMEHYYRNLYAGILDFGDLVYYISLTALALFLSSQVVEVRRWR